MTVGELLERVGSHELTQWMAYEQLEGLLGPARFDWLNAHLIWALAEVHRNPKRRRRRYKLEDFLLWRRKEAQPEPEAADWQSIRDKLRATLGKASAGQTEGR